jgi:hypothetical protein
MSEPEHAEKLWDQLIDYLAKLQAMRWLEQIESDLLEGPHDHLARRMLDIIAVKKLDKEKWIARIVDEIASHPYWDDKIASLDRDHLAEQQRRFGGRNN